MQQHKSTRAAVEATLKELDLGPADAAAVSLARELAAQVDAAKAESGADRMVVFQQVRLAAGRLDKVLDGLRRSVQERQRGRAAAAAAAEAAQYQPTDEDERAELVFAELQDRAARRRGEVVPVDESPARGAVRAEMEAGYARMVAEHGAAAPVPDEELDDDDEG